jgi:hypothetical protein
MAMLLSPREEIRALSLARSQPATAGELRDLIEEIKKRTVDTVLAEERVRARLAGVRHRVLAVDYREDKPSAGEQSPMRLAEVGIYDYKKDVLVVAVVDLRQGTVLALEERPGVQPPVTEEELTEACRLVTNIHPNYRLNQPGRTAVAFPTPRYLLGRGRARHRCVTLYFSPEPERGAAVGATQTTVDLSGEEVVPQQEILTGSPRLNPESEPNN